MTDANFPKINSTNLGKTFILALVPQKVMHGATHDSVQFLATSRGAPMFNRVSDLMLDLHNANQARRFYENTPSIPLQDLFYVGGQLQDLIRRSEKELNEWDESEYDYSEFTHSVMRYRVNEAKDFRKYIVKRISLGF